jgi:hypothetical protein
MTEEKNDIVKTDTGEGLCGFKRSVMEFRFSFLL